MFKPLAVAAAFIVFLPASALGAPELSVTDGKYPLKDRRYVAAGDQSYVMGFEDGRFYAQGWHITGEMGGVWSQPLKFVDGVWFGVDEQWVGPATRFTSGWGYTRMDFPEISGLQLSRTDFAPDGRRAALFGLRIENPGAERTVSVKVDAHSELLNHYPWAWTTPNAGEFNLQDTGAYDAGRGALVFREDGQPHPNAEEHHWAALVGSNVQPVGHALGPGHRGPQDPPVPCDDQTQPNESLRVKHCDEGPFGKGTGGQLRYDLTLPAGGSRTLWVAVAGSDEGVGPAQAELDAALSDPEAALREKIAARESWAQWTQLSLPGDRRLADGIDWGKQNLLDLTQYAEDLEIRDVDEGRQYPPPMGTVPRARWLGAGYPDYPWIFATDAEYTAFANVAVGQFESIKDHARALRDISLILNGDSGKVTHETVADGANYFGANDDPGNTDETAKFPSLVALIWRWTGDNAFRDEMYDYVKSNVEWIFREEDDDRDGWPEGRGNVERGGMGEEKLDNAVYTIRALYDLADMARSKGDEATRAWARAKARDLVSRFEGSWWMEEFKQYADSLDPPPPDPSNPKLQQKHWIGVTPMEAELTPRRRVWPGLASFEHGTDALREREQPCYSGERPYNRGLFHTGCGGGETGQGEQVVFSLNTAIQAVGEGNYGRLGETEQKRYTDANLETMFAEPWTGETPDEQPGAMPEIFPSPDFDRTGPRDANVDRCTRCRAMMMQAWGHYGTMWPVVHQQLGVRPDMGRRRLEVVPQLPPFDPPEGRSGRNIRLGSGALALVHGSRAGNRYRTEVHTGSAPVRRLLIGHTLPRGSRPVTVFLDGVRRDDFRERLTNRGVEVTVRTGPGHHVLEVCTGVDCEAADRPAPPGGVDRPTPPGLAAGACANTQNGTDGDEVLTGTNAGDRINGLGGTDVIRGLPGDDCLSGGTDLDKLTADAGNDRLAGGDGNDIMAGGGDNDVSTGGAGADRLNGDTGSDRMAGSRGADRLNGGRGRDRMSGGAGNDRLSGGSGNDRMAGNRGRNRLFGGAGNDRINSVNGRRETVNCGRGRRDRARVDRRDRTRGCEQVTRRR
jgi:hypothetical protein